MRMDTTTGPTAADLLREASESEIADAIYEFGEERFSRRIARAIIQARELGPLDTTVQLAGIVRRAVPKRGFSRIDCVPWRGIWRQGRDWSSSPSTRWRTASSSTRCERWRTAKARACAF
jgi:hypothetical protein